MTAAVENTCRYPRRKSGVLFISYTGLLEPLGQSQVLAYQEKLAADHPVHLLTFERGDDLAIPSRVEAVQERVRRAGIHWHPLRYHKRFSLLTTLWDILMGIWKGWRLVRTHGLRIVHARSYVAGVMALALKHLTGARFLFDMRGFWVDERVDGGLWPRGGTLYLLGKWVERRLLLGADHLVSLTHAAAEEIRTFDYLQGSLPPITVIPTCADLTRFRPLGSGRDEGSWTLGYVGSVGTWYLFDEAVAVFKEIAERRGNAKFLILNRGSHGYILDRLAVAGVPQDRFELLEASHSEIPVRMARMNAGVFFYKTAYSRAACAPTKLGEFLGCGVPVLANTGVGDMARILREDGVGVAIDSVDQASIRAGVSELLDLCADPGTRQRCVESAERHFSLEEGVRGYRSIYKAIA